MVAETPHRIAISRLSLTDFRCYRSAVLALGPEPVILTGPNGAGKTNILEAVSFLAPGRGLRRARLSEVDRRNSEEGTPCFWAVAAELTGLQGQVLIGTGRDPARPDQERRAVRIDRAPARSQSVLGEHVAMVWLTPQMDRLFQDGASGRRRFLDRLVLGYDPGHGSLVATYENTLRERGRLLREGGDSKWIGALEENLASHGIAIAAARRDIAMRLNEAAEREAEAGPFPRAVLAVTGTVENWLGEMPALAAEERFRERLRQSRRHDAESGGSVIGPHRADLVVRQGASGLEAALASTGEQKALLIAILLAHARLQRDLHGAAPILLLDEVAAHLDAGHRTGLYHALSELGIQAWMTGTEDSFFAPLRGGARFLSVTDARIAEG